MSLISPTRLHTPFASKRSPDDKRVIIGTKAPPACYRTGSRNAGMNPMLKYAIIFLVISLIAGALGLVNVSTVARRISMVLFAVFFLIAAALFGIVVLVGEAVVH
jgi:uncharacterized membrane protein YtjA (UPF0391 family)